MLMGGEEGDFTTDLVNIRASESGGEIVGTLENAAWKLEIEQQFKWEANKEWEMDKKWWHGHKACWLILHVVYKNISHDELNCYILSDDTYAGRGGVKFPIQTFFTP